MQPVRKNHRSRRRLAFAALLLALATPKPKEALNPAE